MNGSINQLNLTESSPGSQVDRQNSKYPAIVDEIPCKNNAIYMVQSMLKAIQKNGRQNDLQGFNLTRGLGLSGMIKWDPFRGDQT